MAHVFIAGIIPECQCGFRLGRCVTDVIFVAHQALDTVNRKDYSSYLAEVQTSLLMYPFPWILGSGELLEAFTFSSGTKQGCVLVPMLFFAMILLPAFKD